MLVVVPFHFNWKILWSNSLTISIIVLEDFQPWKNYSYSTKMVMFPIFSLDKGTMLPWKCNHVPNECLSSLWEHVCISNTFLGECTIIFPRNTCLKGSSTQPSLEDMVVFPKEIVFPKCVELFLGLMFSKVMFLKKCFPIGQMCWTTLRGYVFWVNGCKQNTMSQQNYFKQGLHVFLPKN